MPAGRPSILVTRMLAQMCRNTWKSKEMTIHDGGGPWPPPAISGPGLFQDVSGREKSRPSSLQRGKHPNYAGGAPGSPGHVKIAPKRESEHN